MANFCTGKQITLGQLLKLVPDNDEITSVVFDFCHLIPKPLLSYRGYYDHLAFGWSADWADVSAEQLRKWLQEAIGTPYEGYKGGTFYMSSDTPLWVANWGQTSDTVIRGVHRQYESQLVLLTAHEDELPE